MDKYQKESLENLAKALSPNDKYIKSFEDYLETLCWEENPQVLDDDMPDFFNNWLSNFDANDILEMVKDYEWNFSHIAGKDQA